MTAEEKKAIETNAITVLRTIYDPEVPVNIYDLGLIYEVKVNDDAELKILMTLTTPNCPVAESLPQEVKDKTALVKDIKSSDVELTFDPPWTQDMLSEEAKLELGLL